MTIGFDTTGSNTVIYIGNAVLLERMLKKRVLRLACRHHILELVIGIVVQVVFDKTVSGTNELLKKFKDHFREVDTSVAVRPLEIDNEWLLMIKLSSVDELSLFCNTSAIRDDYKEFTQLSLMLLGYDFCCILYFVYQSEQHTRINVSFVMHESLFEASFRKPFQE